VHGVVRPVGRSPAGRAPVSYVTDGRSPPRRWAPVDAVELVRPEGNYCIGEALSRSRRILGPWRQSERPLYEADGGYGMLFSSAHRPDELYLAIHTPNATRDERPVFVEIADGLVATGGVIS